MCIETSFTSIPDEDEAISFVSLPGGITLGAFSFKGEGNMSDEETVQEVKLNSGGEWVDGNGNPTSPPENAEELHAAWQAEQAAAEAAAQVSEVVDPAPAEPPAE